METLTKTTDKNVVKSNCMIYTLLFSFMVLFAITGVAQSDAVVQDKAAQQEEIEAQKRIEHKSFMNYVYMGLGFALIIGVALAGSMMKSKKKKTNIDTGEGSHIITHHHSSHDKKYGKSRHGAGH